MGSSLVSAAFFIAAAVGLRVAHFNSQTDVQAASWHVLQLWLLCRPVNISR